jgi:hypothetical protein
VNAGGEGTRAAEAVVLAVVLAVALAGAACGSGDDGDGAVTGASAGDAPGSAVGTTAESSPFVVEDPPDGYQLVLAGQGDWPQTWSSDSFGDDEPVTVLAPPGEGADSPESVTVSLTGYAGFQGGLDQASAGYLGDDVEEFEIDGQRALYTPPGGPARFTPEADLVVAVGEDLAVRVRSATGTRDELAEVARRVRPRDDHLLAPDVPEPPAGLEVVGHADADVPITLEVWAEPGSDYLPAGTRAHTALWARLDGNGAWTPMSPTVAVSTLPGASAAFDGLAAGVRLRRSAAPMVQELSVAGRPAVVLELEGVELDEGPLARRRAVVTSTPDGDLLLVVAAGVEVPAPEELLAVAASVGPATPDAWEALQVEARGGPGLRPDPGAVELERGEAESTEWLFQARVDDGSAWSSSDQIDPDTGRSVTEGEYLIDPCLKLAEGQRACVGPGGSESEWATGHRVITRVRGPVDGGGQFPGFVMVMTSHPAVALRISGAAGVRDVPFHELPGGERRAAVIVTDEPAGLACDRATPPPVVIEMVDAAGQPLPCP